MSSILTGSSPRGPTDKASDYESGDCGFESHRGCFCALAILIDNNFKSEILYFAHKKFPRRDLNPGLTGESRVS